MKKNKLLTILTVLFIFALCCTALSACSNTDTNTDTDSVTNSIIGSASDSAINSSTVSATVSAINSSTVSATVSVTDSATDSVIENYTITYELNGGTNNFSNPTSYTSKMETITLQNPTRTGYTFVKWTEGNTITAGSTGNKTFTAKWTKNTYTITYVLGGGTNHTDNPNGYDIDSTTITLQNPTRTGYTFVKWTEGNTITMGSTGNKTFTAEWNIINYDIEYTLNGGTQNMANPTENTVESASITLSNPTYTGYAFGGWFDNEEFTGTAIMTISTGTIGNKHFYAKWNDIFTRSGTAITGLTEIGNTIGEMTIPAGFISIADNAFKDKTNITSFVVPADITSIGANAFSGCTNLSSVTLNEGVQTLGANAFVKCAFTTFTVPSTVVSVGDSLLGGCANLTELTIPYTGNNADATATGGAHNFGWIFGGTVYSEPEFVLCQSLKANGYPANYYIPAGLETVSFNKNIATIKGDAFRNCIMLEVVNMPDTVKTIDNGAFYGCTALTSIIIPSGVTTIANGALSNCANLSSVTLQSETVVTNLETAGIFETDRTIYVPSAILDSYITSYSGYSSRFAVITE